LIYAKQWQKLQKPAGFFCGGFRLQVNIGGQRFQFTPQVLQACELQEVQAGALWVIVRPSEWAKNKESLRIVF
jgi:hypothetical protein